MSVGIVTGSSSTHLPRFVDADVPLATYLSGQGEPVLMIMGLACCAADWGPLHAQLATCSRVITFDNRGTGQSKARLSGLSLEQMAEDALAVMDAHGLERVNLVGYSMGGMIAQLLALAHPERVSRLALVATHPGARSGTPPVPAAMDVLMRPYTDVVQLVRDQFLVFSAPDFPHKHPEQFERMLAVRLANPTPLQTVVLQLQAMQESERADRLAALRMPTLVVHGRLDALVPFANGEKLQRLLPQAELCALDDCGHMLAWEAPDRLGQVLAKFFGL